jgi:hypothetical protein
MTIGLDPLRTSGRLRRQRKIHNPDRLADPATGADGQDAVVRPTSTCPPLTAGEPSSRAGPPPPWAGHGPTPAPAANAASSSTAPPGKSGPSHAPAAHQAPARPHRAIRPRSIHKIGPDLETTGQGPFTQVRIDTAAPGPDRDATATGHQAVWVPSLNCTARRFRRWRRMPSSSASDT